MSGGHLSKDFFELVKSIGESKSKQEEDRIIVKEVAVLKGMMGETRITPKRLKEFLVRMIYVEMLGHDASFGYIKAVELTAKGNLLQKRVGYLCAGLCFAPDHEFRLMLVNRLQKDMVSSNLLEVMAALMAACKLITEDMIPAVLPTVTELLKHDQENVRKKAVMVLQRFNNMAPAAVEHLGDRFRRVLCDKDPSVMGASLHVLYDLARADPTSYKDLVPSFVSILKQITEHRLPREFDYHRIPAPWIQMKLLRILAILGSSDQKASEGMYEVLLDVMRRADTGIMVGYAIIYECVHTVTTIYPNSTLLDAAAAAIARFIKSDNHNLKYLGVTGLTAIIKDHPKYAQEHQLAVIDCLEDPDETLQRKTLSLLFRMTNPYNVEVIVDKLITYLRSAVDVFLRMELVTRVTEAAERFAPNNNWYISTMTDVFEIGGDLVRGEMAQNVVNLISEGTGEDDEEADSSLRRHAVETYLALLDKPALPDVLLQVLFWVLGEYGYLAESLTLEQILDRVCALAGRSNVDVTTRGYALNAAMKLTAQLGRVTAAAADVVERYAESRHVDLAQRCHEFRQLLARPAAMAEVLPVDASAEEIDVDEDLSFANAFVGDCLARGAKEYQNHDDDVLSDDGPEEDVGTGGLRFEAYDNPEESTTVSEDAGQSATLGSQPSSGGLDLAGGGGLAGGGLGGGVKSVWGETGYAGSGTSASNVGGGKQPEEPKAQEPPIAGGHLRRPWDAPGASSPSAAERAPTRTKTPEPSPTIEKPKELSEKEKAAAALFGGVFGGAASPPASSPGRRVASASKPKPTPVPAAEPAAPAASGVDDLLGLGFGGPTTTPAAVADPFASTGSPAASSGVEDLFGGMSKSSPAPVTADPAPAATSTDPFGAFDGLVGGGGGGAAPALPDLSSTPVPAALGTAVAGERSSAGNETLASDSNVVVAGHKVWTDGGIAVVVFVAAGGTALSAVTAQLDAPAFLRGTVSGAPAPHPAGDNTVVVGNLAAGANSCLVASYALCAAPANGAAVSGTISYEALGGAAGKVSFSVAIDCSDTLRPAPIDTRTFGGNWGANTAEKKVGFRSGSVTSPEAFMVAAKRVLHAHPVETIAATSEAIAASRLMGCWRLHAVARMC